MIGQTISRRDAQRFYDWLGAWHDSAELFEAEAKQRGLERLRVAAGDRVLNVGVGTGKEHALIQAAVTPGGWAAGLDLSPVMARLAQQRTGAPVCRATAQRLPLETASVTALFGSYVLDLIPAVWLPGILSEFWRVLAPGGRLALVSLTEGVDRPSRAVVAVWKAAYAVSPLMCGGCRPLQLAPLVEAAGFKSVQREVVVQMAVPSEVISARR